MKLDLDLTEEQIERIKEMLAEEEREAGAEIEVVDIPNREYKMGKYPVTQAQYEAVMGTNPSQVKDPQMPVTNVSWHDAKEFCRKLSEQSDEYDYRLPEEDEWEYCARAGVGDPENLDDYAWYIDNSNDKPHKVGKKKPNAWGLYDMLGNVWEWMQ